MIAAGDLISDRTEQRLALESQISRVESAIKQSEQATAPMPALPAPDYSQELAELDRAQGMAKYWEALPMPEPRFKGELAQLDYATINRQRELEAERLRAQLSVQQALARLEAAQASYESLKYKHQLERSDWEANRQRQEYQIGQLQQQLADLQDKLSRLSVVRSPVSGTIRRVRILGQSDRSL
jgi:multidrug resistance efflux pump